MIMSKRHAVREAFFKLRKAHPELGISQIVDLLVNHPAPKFFCTLENARRILSRIDKGLSIPISDENKVRMYHDIYNKWVEFRNRPENQGKKLRYTEHLQGILDSEAPSFYLSKYTLLCQISGPDNGAGGKRCY